MKRFYSIYLLLLAATALSSMAEAELLLAEGGEARAAILVGRDASPAERYAAEELQRFLGEISGASFALVASADEAGGLALIDVGNTTAKLPLPGEAYGGEEYHLRTLDNALVIAGGRPRGVLYGVYALLEEVLGCRWFTPEVSHIPRMERLALPDLDLRHAPVLEYREPFVMDCYDGDWSARNRMNGNRASLQEKHGGKVAYRGFVHTFNELIPPDPYFDEHPEYFSEIDGERRKEKSQLCCTNPDVIRLVTEGVRQWMRDHPEATVYSVSQNDWFNYCECRNCAALAEREESQMAPVLALVNHVADAVRDEFPGKVVDTLAYQWTRKAPKTIRPASNVVVRLCSIECCFAHPFDQCSSRANREFVKDAEAWKATGARLWVWDYVTSFNSYLVPFPNLRVRQPNIKFFIDHGVRGIFEQDVYQTPHGEFSSLSGYLNAKLLWNPDYNPDTAINEFLEGVYGAGAPHLRAWLDLLHNTMARSGMHLNIWVGAEAKYLDDELLARADTLFDKAEAAVAADPGALARVRAARLSIDYTQLERARNTQKNLYAVDHGAFTVKLQPEFRQRMERFFTTAEQCGFTTLREMDGDIGKYKEGFTVFGEDRVLTPRDGVAAKPSKRGLNYAYYEGVFEAMPDFDALQPVKTGAASAVSLRHADRMDGIAFRFQGYFHAPQDGVYSFALESNDGSQLFLHDELVVDNGGQHKLKTESGVVALKAGYHPVTITFFESGGEEGLELHLEGPGIDPGKLSPRLFARD